MEILLIILALSVLFNIILIILHTTAARRFRNPDGILYIDTSDPITYMYRLKMNHEVDQIMDVSYVILSVDPSADLRAIQDE